MASHSPTPPQPFNEYLSGSNFEFYHAISIIYVFAHSSFLARQIPPIFYSLQASHSGFEWPAIHPSIYVTHGGSTAALEECQN